jgi:hypothetical protein
MLQKGYGGLDRFDEYDLNTVEKAATKSAIPGARRLSGDEIRQLHSLWGFERCYAKQTTSAEIPNRDSQSWVSAPLAIRAASCVFVFSLFRS